MKHAGLTSQEVYKQTQAGNINYIPDTSDKTVKEIVRENIFTYFNAIFAAIAVLVIIAGSFRSLTFLPVVIANTVIGIFQQLKAKKILDKLSLLDKSTYTVIRNGQAESCSSDVLVLGDLVLIKSGQQIPADGYVEDGFALVNESLLTGEADEVEKRQGSELKSGSFVVAGSCYMTLTSVGENSYAAKLMSEAKKVHDKKSEMINDIESIIKIAGILIIPIGIFLFVQSIINGNSFSESIVSMVGAVIGMIPEGMYLLTTGALALSAIRLGKHHVLLHDMRSIETLARVDVLCVDKTGTITRNEMTVEEVFSPADISNEDFNKYTNILNRYINTMDDTNLTMTALKEYFTETDKLDAVSTSAYSSRTKYSSVKTKNHEYRLGAPEILLSEDDINANRLLLEQRTGCGQRVLAFVAIEDDKSTPLVFISLENEVRENSREIFNYFAEQGVDIKVISGDNPMTVSTVAQKAGIKHSEFYIDATTLSSKEDIFHAVKRYTVFGRVKPEQKKQIVEALQEQKLKVAMTGDGINDILAMKEADCSIAMGTGSDAAREASQVVLMDSDFSHLKEIVAEGRRDINNITRSSTLFLYKNMFSLFLAVFSIINSFTYPLQPSQVSLVSMFNIGIPSFFLALERNEAKQHGRFIVQTIIRALPAAITSFVSIAALVVFSKLFNLPEDGIGTASTYLLSIVGFIILYELCIPQNKYRVSVFVLCIAGFLGCSTCLYSLFAIEDLSLQYAALCIVFAIAEITIMRWLTKVMEFFRQKIIR